MQPPVAVPDENPIIFEPEYTRGERLALPAYSAGLVFCIGLALLNGSALLGGMVGALCLSGGILAHTKALPQRLLFDPQGFTVYRLLWPNKRISYSEVTDLGLHRIVTRRGTVNLTHFQNGDELAQIVRGLLDSGRVDEEQLAGRAATADMWRTSGLFGAGFAILAGHALGALFAVLGWYPATMNPFTFVLAVGFGCGALGYVVCRFLFFIHIVPDEAAEEPAA